MKGIPQRLFLSEIYDIDEYNERNKEAWKWTKKSVKLVIVI
jgi:hypothetical protein